MYNRSEAFKKLKTDRPKFANYIIGGMKLRDFDNEYEEYIEEETLQIDLHLQGLIETDNLYGNLGRI